MPDIYDLISYSSNKCFCFSGGSYPRSFLYRGIHLPFHKIYQTYFTMIVLYYSNPLHKIVFDRNQMLLIHVVSGYDNDYVAFTAHAALSRSYGINDIFLFDSVITNTGNHYNGKTSAFVCPFDGVFFFIKCIVLFRLQ